MGQLDGKTALVTGASTGIGLAIARRFATEGATVYLTGRREAELNTAGAQVGSHGIGIRSDVSHLDDLDRLFAEITKRSGSLDIVVANAGVGDYRPLGGSPRRSTNRPPPSTSRARSSPSKRPCPSWRPAPR
jgi:NAD(P)-dependent dehydrogenase (short-subunit alcohol dehydrogenase family)